MNNNKSSEWWSDSRFWNSFDVLMFDAERWDAAEKEIDGMMKLAGSSPPEHILDLGCGPGRHSLEMAGRGFRVTGIDINNNYLETAEKLSREKNNDFPPEFRYCDMREFFSDRDFDGAVSLFQTLGYFDNPEDDLKVCRNVYNSLKPGGWFLVELDGKEAAAASFEERTWMERDGRIILLEYEAVAAWSILRNRWQFRDTDGSWHEYEFSYRLYSAVELGQLLEKAGFSSTEFFGDFDGRPYNQKANRLVALARR